MIRYLLDTNIASHIMRKDMPGLLKKIAHIPMTRTAISVISQAELLYGVAKCGHPSKLSGMVRAFLEQTEILPWTEEDADTYAELRTACEARGVTLAAMDMMIAAQAKATGLILVSRDKAFARIEGLEVEDWTV